MAMGTAHVAHSSQNSDLKHQLLSISCTLMVSFVAINHYCSPIKEGINPQLGSLVLSSARCCLKTDNDP